MYARAKLLKDKAGKPIRCSNACCNNLANHVHHSQYRSEGGSDDLSNLVCLCEKCHRQLHSAAGDFINWGKQGGLKTAAKQVSIPNLKQFQGPEGAARYAAYLEKRANQQMGVTS